jgi:hypothetical protein
MNISDYCYLEFENGKALIRCYNCGSVAHFDDKKELKKWKTEIIKQKWFIKYFDVCRFFCEKCKKRKRGGEK